MKEQIIAIIFSIVVSIIAVNYIEKKWGGSDEGNEG
jgi:ABC-type cobalt transport system substrate-binding protein